MTTEELQAHQNEMAVQRERFHQFWEQIIEPYLDLNERDLMKLQHRAWNLWREEITDYKRKVG